MGLDFSKTCSYLQVCHSQAWDSKIVTSSWWVYPHQVSKTAPTGEYLTVGSFMIRGKKNFLPPHPLVMGLGILFRLDESSLASHLNERRVRGEDEGLQEMEGASHNEHNVSASDEEILDDADTSKELDHLSRLSIHNSKVDLDSTSAIDNVSVVLPPNPNISNLSEEPVGDKEWQQKNLHGGNLSNTDEKSEHSVSSQLDVLIDEALGLGPTKLSGKGAGLDVHKLNSMEDHEHEGNKATVREKPYISKAERRKLKKGQNNSNDSVSSSYEKEEGNECAPSSSQLDKNIENLKPVKQKITRGQKGKLKKIKEKYAEQDDEERKIRMALLAVST